MLRKGWGASLLLTQHFPTLFIAHRKRKRRRKRVLLATAGPGDAGIRSGIAAVGRRSTETGRFPAAVDARDAYLGAPPVSGFRRTRPPACPRPAIPSPADRSRAPAAARPDCCGRLGVLI